VRVFPWSRLLKTTSNLQSVFTPYTLFQTTSMKKTKIFKSESQAEIVLREPKRNLGKAFEALGAMPEDFMSGGRQDRPPQKRNV
jgi:hypothetical protein